MTQPIQITPLPTEALRVPISLYADDIEYIDGLDAETGARNRSATIRRILREHQRASGRMWPALAEALAVPAQELQAA